MTATRQADSLEKGKVTIGIVNYKTEELTKLCLRSIRKFTKYPYKVVVVDNDSGDASLDYLRSVSWIKLIERPGEVHKSGSWAHGTGLDLCFDSAGTEYFVAMHSDTFVYKPGWLEYLINLAEKEPKAACVGAGKMDLKPKWEVILKRCTDAKALLRKLKGENKRNDFYVRTICGLYRTEALLKENLCFNMNVDDGVTCGKQLYYELIDKGYPTRAVSSYVMADYIHHLAHATMVLNPEFKVRERTEQKCRKALLKVLGSPLAKSILIDDSLDR